MKRNGGGVEYGSFDGDLTKESVDLDGMQELNKLTEGQLSGR